MDGSICYDDNVVMCVHRVMHSLLQGSGGYQDVVLVMLGSTRNAADEAIAQGLEEQAAQLGLQTNVRVVRNPSYAELKRYIHMCITLCLVVVRLLLL